MNIAPFLQADLATQIHVVLALVAVVSGFAVFAIRKGMRAHRMLGRVWIGAMVIVALSSFFIHGLRVWGPFSPLHLLSVHTMATVVFAIVMVRRGNIRAHKLSLIGLFLGGVIGAGLLTLSRGLLMSRILFPDGTSPIPSPADLPGGPVGVAVGMALAITGGMLFFGWLFDEKRAAQPAQMEA